MGAFASQSKWRWTWGSCWKVSTFPLAAVSQGTQSSDLISSKCSHPRSLLLVQVTLKRSPAGALGPSWWDVIVCQSSFLKNEKRFKCRPAGISVSCSQSKGACRLGCCLKCRGEKNGWTLRWFVLTAIEEDGSGWTHVLPFSRSDILPMAESFFWTSLKISLTSFFFFLFSKNDYGLFSSSTQISNCCFLVGKMCGDCFEPQEKGQSFYTERKLFIIPIMHLSICFPDTHPVHTVRVRSICVLLYPGYPYVSLKAQLHFIFYETFSKSSKKD